MKRAQIAAGFAALLVLSGCGSSSAMNEITLSYEGTNLKYMGETVQCVKDQTGVISAVVEQSENKADPTVLNVTLMEQSGVEMVNLYATVNKVIVATPAIETKKNGDTYEYKGRAALTGSEQKEVDIEGTLRCATFVKSTESNSAPTN